MKMTKSPQNSDTGESTDSDGEVREHGGAEDLGEDEQRRREFVRRGRRGLNSGECHGTNCALERRLLKYRAVNQILNFVKMTIKEILRLIDASTSPFLSLLSITV